MPWCSRSFREALNCAPGLQRNASLSNDAELFQAGGSFRHKLDSRQVAGDFSDVLLMFFLTIFWCFFLDDFLGFFHDVFLVSVFLCLFLMVFFSWCFYGVFLHVFFYVFFWCSFIVFFSWYFSWCFFTFYFLMFFYVLFFILVFFGFFLCLFVSFDVFSWYLFHVVFANMSFCSPWCLSYQQGNSADRKKKSQSKVRSGSTIRNYVQKLSECSINYMN